MKTLFCLLFIFFGFKQAGAQQVDSAVLKVVDANFKVISEYLNKKETSLQKISDAIIFFTDLTGIQSESDGKYYGQFHPTKNDLNAWTAWYTFNKAYLFWDKDIKSILLYKKVKPAIF
jgi:hypothetical protein